MTRRRIFWGIAAGVFILTVLPYVRTVGYGIINLDDYLYVADKPQLEAGFCLPTLRWLLTSVDDAIWMPATRFSYLLDWVFFGGHAGAMHAVNAAIHGLNGVLLFALLFLMFGGAGLRHGGGRDRGFLLLCGVGALLWSMHPLRVEPVAWVASRKDVLSLFFELIALGLWLRRLDHEESSFRGNAYGWLAVAAFVLAGMAKPTAMTFPVLAGLLEYWKRGGTVRWRDYGIPLVISCGLAVVALHAQRAGGATAPLAHVPLYGRLLNAVAAVGIYCWKSVCPTGLAVQCMNQWPGLPRFWWQGLVICAAYGAALAVLAVRLFGSALAAAKEGRSWGGTAGSDGERLVFACLTFFLVAAGPTLGISNFGVHAFADRFTYLPAVGFSMLFVGLLAQGVGDKGFRRVLACAGCAALLFGGLSARQTRYWENEKTLFSRTLEIDGADSIYANNVLGLYYYEVEHDLTRSRMYLDRAYNDLRRTSLHQDHLVYIKILAETGELRRARAEATRFLAEMDMMVNGRLLSLDATLRKSAVSYLVYAMISFEEGETELAKQHILKYEELSPGSTWTAYLLGRIAMKEGDTAEAVRQWKRSVSTTSAYIRHRFLEPEIRRLEKGIL